MLTFQPCGGVVSSCCEKNTQEKTEALSLNDQESDKGCCDNGCSSICMCSGCGNILMQPDVAELDLHELPTLTHEQPKFAYQMVISLFLSNIWQPPQIG